jgi:hypothetical protein
LPWPRLLQRIASAESYCPKKFVDGCSSERIRDVVAARKVKAGELYTLDARDFLAFNRPGDPEVAMP